NDEAHINAHYDMSASLKDCDYIVLKRGCKNTINAFKQENVGVKKYSGELNNAKEIVSFMANEFK
ncbi:MAG: hypothetical protein U9N42_03165, partial [Campylobacterota bacterium]|nr:hypothetical protein [Campylobacterota bacterium]